MAMRAGVVVTVIALGCSGPPAKQPASPAHEPAAGPIAPVPLPGPVKPTAIPTRSSDVVVTVTGQRVVMNGVEISGKPMVTDLFVVFGKPDRTWDQGGQNKVHTWDRIGLLVYEPHDGRCISATFPYKPMSTGYDPATMFAGTIVVDGRRFTSSTKLATVKAWPGATMPYSPSSVVFDKADIHVFTIEETANAGAIDLVEISFWQRGKDATVKPAEPSSTHARTRLLELDCRAGDARMCTRLALIFQTGANAEKNPARAFTFAGLACEGGDAFACTMRGNMYEAGHGTKRSSLDARLAWKKACSLGDAVGCARAK